MQQPTLESAFAAVAAPPDYEAALGRLRERFQEPIRAYHNEAHTVKVLECVYRWSKGQPSPALVAAAMYHDAVYDPTQSDNEARSAELCQQELSALGLSAVVVARAADLILLTAHHLPSSGDPDGILLADADLYILGGTDAEYESYRTAIRAEYAHVPEPLWVAGRNRVLERFLERPRIYHGDWDRVDVWEARARNHITRESAYLVRAGI